jgi:hypothetical protein
LAGGGTWPAAFRKTLIATLSVCKGLEKQLNPVVAAQQQILMEDGRKKGW